MANFSDTDKRSAGAENRKKAGSPAPKHKSGPSPERDELAESQLNKVAGRVKDDPCAGGQFHNR